MEKKLRVELTLAILAVILVGCIGVGLYVFYSPKSVATSTFDTSDSAKSEGTTKVETTSDPSVKKVTAPASSNIQVKTAGGTVVSIPAAAPTK